METKKYTAFISYSHDDSYWADILQKKLEHFYIPVALRDSNPEMPANVRPIFKDNTDLTPGSLSQRITNALDNSSFLIVICSKASAASQWVNKEVEHFINSGHISHIIPILVNDIADNNIDNFMPQGLRELKGNDELLWVDLRNEGIDRTVVKIIAVILNIQFDTLWQRHLKENRRRTRQRIFAYSLVVGVIGALAIFGISQYSKLKRNELTTKQNNIAEQSILLTKEGNLLDAIQLLTADNGKYLETYNSNIDKALRVAIDAYERPGWVLINKGTMTLPALPYPDGFGPTESILCDCDSCYVKYNIDTSDITITDFNNNTKSVINIPEARYVEDAAISSDGTTLAYRSVDVDVFDTATLSIIDTSSLTTMRQLSVPAEALVASYDISNNGSRIITAINGVVSVIDIATGNTLHQLSHHDGEDACIFVNVISDNLVQLSSTSGNSLIYDFISGIPLMQPDIDYRIGKTINDIDNKNITFVTLDNVSYTYHYNGPEKKELQLPIVCAMSHAGEKIATINDDGLIEIHNTLDNRLISTLANNPDESILSMAFNQQNDRLTVAYDHGIKSYDIKTGKEISDKNYDKYYIYEISDNAENLIISDKHDEYIYCVADASKINITDEAQVYFNRDCSILARLYYENETNTRLELYHTGDSKPYNTLSVDLSLTDDYSFSFDNNYLAVLRQSSDYSNYMVCVISLTDGATVACYEDPGFDYYTTIQFTDYALAINKNSSSMTTALRFHRWYSYNALSARALEIAERSK
ncbi:MAG: toll/interleukin-1 receptor domain-containing protein [Bacteroidales bacterium]|nr:toll/interleukin-1 receptor domain-containing protein [Bacteroidales bacterium]